MRFWKGGTYDRRNETVSASRDRLHEARVLGCIAQHFAQPHDGIVQSVVKIDKGIAGPKAIAQFFSCDNFARLLQQHDQNLERLLWKFDSESMFPELASLQIDFKNTEMQNPRNRRRATHGSGWEYSLRWRARSKLESESSILLVFNDKRKDAEMFPIGHIEYCVKALSAAQIVAAKKVLFCDGGDPFAGCGTQSLPNHETRATTMIEQTMIEKRFETAVGCDDVPGACALLDLVLVGASRSPGVRRHHVGPDHRPVGCGHPERQRFHQEYGDWGSA